MRTPKQADDPFRIANPGGLVKGLLAGLGTRMLGLSRLGKVYRRLSPRLDGGSFSEQALQELGIGIDLEEEGLRRIPREGPLVLVANHPFGGLEGLAMMGAASRVRPDFRIMANHLLQRIPQLRETVIPVDVFGSEEAARKNYGPLRDCFRWLTRGGAMGVFPAGEVATFHPRERAVLDPPWSPTVARLIRRSGATVVPIHFAGRNSLLFQALSQVHPLLRTLMLGRELLKKKGHTIRMRVGEPIGPDKLARLGGDRELIDYLRVRTCLLGEEERDRRSAESRTVIQGNAKPIVPPLSREELEEEVAALDPEQRLAANGEMEVWLAPAERIPRILHEIGRLREFSFRAVGEGTGAVIDLDSFDRYYQHLFVWHRGEGAVVGAYRLGRTDEIVRRRGVQGLYTSTLFRFNRQLLSQIAPAVELGRSFVQPRFQQSYTPLLLLWKGIGRYVVKNPECTGLFGPVSISNEYRDLSRRLMVSYLTDTRLAPDLARLCRARNPLKRKNVAPDLHLAASGDIDSISDLISAIEGEPRGVPVLVRQYLKLGARFLGFNVDQDFGNALDGLLYVDLTRTSTRILERYMGKKEAAAYKARHKGQVIPAA